MNSSVVTVTLNPALDKTVTIHGMQIGGLNRVQQMRLDPGGKGINVAKVLNQFGVDVIATGLVAGSQGRFLLKQLEEQQIQTGFLEINGETRTNLKIYDEDSKITTEINEPGFSVNHEDLQIYRQKLLELLHHTSVLVVGGSLPPGVPEDIYREYIQMANGLGVKTILDADGVPFQEGIEGKPYAIKPNRFELEQWVGHELKTESEVVSAGKQLLKTGVSLVLVSMGSEGSIVMDQHETFRVYSFPITPKSTVGAGDSMVAALVYSLLNGKTLKDTAVWATTAGTVTASKSGTQVCTLPEVQQCVSRVHASIL
ncbi:1-phosphofructokinase [Effusibacillus consociatus]|uniref:Tagatose-6-phosphate kinase n=1 Tax=Effusibacillus consociatus TaxID=1117041 RepID=A0ABV9Q2A3_9BACL